MWFLHRNMWVNREPVMKCCMSSVHKSARLNMPKWLTFTSIFIRLPTHFYNKCISISKHEHSMVIHIASLMRVNLHNTGKYPHKHIQILANQQPIQLSNNKVTAPTSEMKVGHTSSAEASMISYIYKRVTVSEEVTSRTLFWVYIQNVFTFQIGWENAPKTAPGVLGP